MINLASSLRADELWLPIREYEGFYEVSNYGRIRSLDREVPVRGNPRQSHKIIKGVIKKWGYDGNGYPKIELTRDGIRKSINIHVLVAQHFVPGYDSGLQVRHLDGDKTNPYFQNLAWGTASENQKDKIIHGTNHQLNKDMCPANHVLAEPNLRVDSLPFRRCLACKKARDAMKTNKRLTKWGFNCVADEYYSLIMKKALPRYLKVEKHLQEKYELSSISRQ